MTRRRVVAAIGVLVAVGVAAILLRTAFAPAGTPAAAIGGVRPSYGPAVTAAVPNTKAITRRFWVPGLTAWYNPQGVAVVDGAVLVSAYRSQASGVFRGPCRVFRLSPSGGEETGHVDVPLPCGHAGGLAIAGADALYVADTHTLFAISPTQAFAGPAPAFRRFPLGPGLIGALALSAPGAIWLGTYRENGPGRLYRFSAAMLAGLPDGEALTLASATAAIEIPSYAQGAAIGPHGGLWVARSDTRWGELDRIEPATGAVERRYAVAAGIEGIAFDRDGRLWAVSEAGARHTYDGFFAALVTPFFPLVFAIDPRRLE